MANENDREFSEEELMNVMGGFQMHSDSEHPFNDEHIYRETKKAELQELKEQLLQQEQKNQGRSR